MTHTRRLVTRANNTNIGSLILMAMVFCSCVANGENGRRGLSATSTSKAATKTPGAATTTSGAAAPTAGAGAAAAASGVGGVFDITKNGAVGDGSTNCNKAFTDTWVQVCASTTPATLLVPKGDFMTGPVIFAGPCKSKVTVDVQGTISATPSGYPEPEWILFEKVDNVLLTGTGTFHGKGEAVWKSDGCGQTAGCTLPPTSIKFRETNNIEITGITSVNAKAFHMFLVKVHNVKVHKIKIVAPAESPNTDGIHLSNADAVTIVDSIIGTGDDCVSVGRGCNNVAVERVTCGPGHGLSVGSLGKYDNEEDVSGIIFRGCKMVGTDNGLRIKTWGGSGPSKASDIKFEDITMDNVKNPIIIDQNYGSKGGDSKVAISNVLFKNVKGTSASKEIVQLMCSKSAPCTGVNVADITLSSAGGAAPAVCTNANVVFGGTVNFPTCGGGGATTATSSATANATAAAPAYGSAPEATTRTAKPTAASTAKPTAAPKS